MYNNCDNFGNKNQAYDINTLLSNWDFQKSGINKKLMDTFGNFETKNISPPMS